VKLMKDGRNSDDEIILTENQSPKTTLTCLSDCTPACNVSWYKDGTLMYDQRRNDINIESNRRHSGNYSCTASGVEGTVASGQVKITVHCK
jgi:hypothetical protein